MQAVTFQQPGQVTVQSKAEPRLILPGDVVVELELAGLCGSDLHPYLGREAGLDRGTTMGHEFVGRVVEVGPAVARLRVGDRVMSPFSTSCGGCSRCARGLTARCAAGELFGWVSGGRGLDGAQAQRVRVPLADSTLVGWPEHLSATAALLCGDVAATGLAAVERLGPAGGPLVVLGLGAVGLCAVFFGRRAGFSPVIAVDSVRSRGELATALGATVLDPADAVTAVPRLLGTAEATAIVEAVGNAPALELALELAAPGAAISIVGVHTGPERIHPTAVYDKNLTIRSGRCSARARMERVFATGLGPLEALVTHRLPLSEAASAYQLFEARTEGVVKVVFDPNS